MSKPLSQSAQKVQDALGELGMSLEVLELPNSTRTAVEAAQAVGCQVGQIVKSLIFKANRTRRPILEPLGKADADFVRQQTGFAIGGVPPVGHSHKIDTYIDRDLLSYQEVWAAAGTPRAVFRLTPQDLSKMTGGLVLDIK